MPKKNTAIHNAMQNGTVRIAGDTKINAGTFGENHADVKIVGALRGLFNRRDSAKVRLFLDHPKGSPVCPYCWEALKAFCKAYNRVQIAPISPASSIPLK